MTARPLQPCSPILHGGDAPLEVPNDVADGHLALARRVVDAVREYPAHVGGTNRSRSPQLVRKAVSPK